MATPKARILLIEGKRADRPSFFTGLTRKGYEVKSVPSGKAALAQLAGSHPHVVVVDAESMRANGKGIVRAIHRATPDLPVIFIIDEDYTDPESVEADCILIQPFTLQKLLNRIRPLLPVEESNLLKVGPLALDVDHRWVRCDNRKASLTPRLVVLMRLLMEHPGKILKRENLFSEVWETAYTDDTRTLDVHISWLRQAVEEDPRHPRYIKTVRGVGYRLDIP
ncbi:MAG: response regulator transcription factor [Anaerolineaceae bacterium]|nr:response regulator transcription factor [Anaerolineaceae bacterium]